MFHVPNQFRVHIRGMRATPEELGNNGLFWIPNRTRESTAPIQVIASDGEGWEHVSVSLPNRCPTWTEMCRVKELFWDPEDCVMQLHPPKSEWISNHQYCLHLWRPVSVWIPTPPSWMVGFKELGVLNENSTQKSLA